jgi:hypothetical protein
MTLPEATIESSAEQHLAPDPPIAFRFGKGGGKQGFLARWDPG